MKLLFLFASLTVAMCALNCSSSLNAQEFLDQPIAINSVAELDKLTISWRSEPKMKLDWDAFSQAVTHIVSYVYSDALQLSSSEVNRMITLLVSGRTPREIIVLGHVIWVEQIKQEIAEANPSTNMTAEETKLRRMTSGLALGHARNAREVLRVYLSKP